MALYQGHIFIPRRLRSEDLAQLQDYQSQIDAYKDKYDTYKQQVEDYNKAIEEWNKGPRTSPFEGVEPTAPAQPGFTQEDIDAFQDEALGRATRRQSQLQTAVNVAQNPEAYGFGGFGFREGGMVPAYPSYGGGGNSGGIMSVLQPFGDYLNEQIDVQRVDPFLEIVSNAAYQEFGIKPEQGGGFFSGGFYKDGGGLPDRDLFGGGGMPHPDQGFDFSNPVPNLPGPIYERPEPNIPDISEGLFGGGLTPAINVSGLETPNLPEIDQGFYDSPEYAAFNSGPKIGTQDMVFSRYFGQQGSGSISGRQDKAYEDYLRRTGQADRIITTNPYAPTVGILPSVTQGPLDFMDGSNIAALANPEVGMAPTGTVQTQEPNYMQSALNYFGDTYDTFNANTGMSSTPMTPELLVQRAQGRLAQRDVKPPEVQAYLQNVVETGGNPTMLAPDMSNNFTNLAASPLSGFQGLQTAGLGGLQLARTQFG